MSDLPCINSNESLFELIQKKRELRKLIAIGFDKGAELSNVNDKIKSLETSAKTGTVSIRLM
jgi:hypothetical protein